MRLAICGGSQMETRFLCAHVREHCRQEGIPAEICALTGLPQLWEGFCPGRYYGVLLGIGDTTGFLAARRLLETDRGCRLVCIDDTPRYALQYLRIHAADFLLRPLQTEQLHRAIRRLTGLE